MVSQNTVNRQEKLFLENYLFSREDIMKSFEMFMEHECLNEDSKCSPLVLKNRLKLCEKFLETIKKCKLPVLTELWCFYEYRYLVGNITLELCDASEIEIENDKISYMTVEVEHTLLNIESEYLTVDQFADLHKVDAKTVNQWINLGKLRHAKKFGHEWLIPNTQDKPGRRFEPIQYVLKKGEKINNNEFPMLSLSDSISVRQDEDLRNKFICSFSNFDTKFESKMDLSKNEIERLEYIIIESGKARLDGLIQYVPNLHRETCQ